MKIRETATTVGGGGVFTHERVREIDDKAPVPDGATVVKDGKLEPYGWRLVQEADPAAPIVAAVVSGPDAPPAVADAPAANSPSVVSATPPAGGTA